MAKKRLTEYLVEVLTKSQTEEGRRELLEERDRLEAATVADELESMAAKTIQDAEAPPT